MIWSLRLCQLIEVLSTPDGVRRTKEFATLFSSSVASRRDAAIVEDRR